jgi:hypothetical protein
LDPELYPTETTPALVNSDPGYEICKQADKHRYAVAPVNRKALPGEGVKLDPGEETVSVVAIVELKM